MRSDFIPLRRTAVAVVIFSWFACGGACRVGAAPVDWVLDADGSWHVAANWSSNPALPGAGDDVTMSVGGANIRTITYSSSATTSIRSLHSDEALLVSGGRLRLTAGTSEVAGPFTLTGGTFEVAGETANFAATGAIDINRGSLAVFAGGAIDLSALGVYDGFTNGNRSWFIASPNSRLDLSGLAQMAGAAGAFQISARAQDGGHIDLSQVADITAGRFAFAAIDAVSLIDLSSLASIQTLSEVGFEASAGGEIRAPLLTSLDRVNLTIRDDSLFPTAQLTRLTNGSVTLDNTSRDLAAISNFDHSRMAAFRGAVVDLPAVTAYDGFANVDKLWQANGAGSRLALSAMTQLSGASNVWNLNISAIDGGQVDLSALATIDRGSVAVLSDGAGSAVDLSQLGTMGQSGARRSVQARDQGTVNLPLVSTMDYVNLTIATGGAVATAPLSSAAHGSITLDNATRDFSAIANVDNSSLAARGGATLSLAGVTSIDAFYNVTKNWIAAGAGSVLDLSNVTQIRGSSNVWVLNVQATAAGVVDLSSLAQVSDGNVSVLADGAGSVVDLQNLPAFGNAAYTRRIEARNGGLVNLPLATTLDGAELVLRSGGSVNTDSLTSLSRGSVVLDNVARDLSTIANIDDTNLTASGGATLTLSNVTAVNGFFSRDKTWLATGANSRLALGAVAQLRGVSAVWEHRVQATAGGVVDLAGLTQIPDGNVSLFADGPGSRIELPQLAVFGANGHARGVEVRNQGVVHLPLVSSLDYTDVILRTGGQLVTSATASLAHGSLTVDNTVAALVGLANVDGSSLAARGGATLALSGVSSFDGFFSHDSVLSASGAGSRLDLASIAQLSGAAGAWITTIRADSGGFVDLSGLNRFDAGRVDIRTADGGGTLRFGAIDLATANQTIHLAAGGRLELLGNFTSRSTVEANVNLDAGTLAFVGAQRQALEVAGRDSGSESTGASNFGIGQLIVGANDLDVDLQLVDFLDNGNRNGSPAEALYLLGIGGSDGLRIFGGSTLHIGSHNNLQVYARIGGAMTDLQTLFPGPNTTIAFDGGFISNLLFGDVNLDQSVNATDIDALCAAIAATNADPIFDLDLSGDLDADDLDLLVHDVLESEYGDANLDGVVDRSDAAILAGNFGLVSAGWARGDFNCDAQVSLADVAILQARLGSGGAVEQVVGQAAGQAVAGFVPVPEPATVTLAAAAALVLLGRSRRGRRRTRRGSDVVTLCRERLAWRRAACAWTVRAGAVIIKQ